ncbi:MAG: class I SAM-dependent methyltransferase [archaeon]
MSDNLYKLDPSIYDEYIDTDMERHNFDIVFKEIAEIAKDRKKIKILDLCCGTGIFPRKWLIKLNNVFYTGVDTNKSFIEYAKKNLKNKNYEFVLGDATKVKIDDSFDIVIATSSYHHIKDKDKRTFLKNIYNHLKEEGSLIIYEKLVSKFKEPVGAVDSASKLYTERIKYMLKREKLTEK